MSAPLKEIIDIDTQIKPEMNSWTSLPDGFELLVEESPDHSLLIDDEDHRLLIQ